MSRRSEEKRQAQNEWIKATRREWQIEWHNAFDRDPALGEIDGFHRPDPLPECPGDDFRLSHGLRHVTPETRFECFSLLPQGAEMHRRFENHLIDPARPLSDSEARNLAWTAARHIVDAGPSEQENWSSLKIVDDDKDRETQASQSEDVSYFFERNLLDPVPDEELRAVAAELFLTEPLYAAGDNYYHLRDWVVAAMFSPAREKVFEAVYRLWKGGWLLRVDQSGLVLFRRV